MKQAVPEPVWDLGIDVVDVADVAEDGYGLEIGRIWSGSPVEDTEIEEGEYLFAVGTSCSVETGECFGESVP